MVTKSADGPSVSKPSQVSPGEQCLAGGGEMGALMRSLDWSSTALGPVARWPQSLKIMVAVMLANRVPMLIWWGPELLQLYNDAYRPVLGGKHPASLGAPGEQVWPELWPELWPIVGPMVKSVRAGGPATFHEHLQLLRNGRGFGQETFHTFSYSPIPDDQGGIGGVLSTVQETTEQVQDDRQLRMLRDLAARAADAKSAEAACRAAAGILALNDADLPFSLVYLRRPGSDGGYAELVSTSGLDAYDGPGKPQRVALTQGNEPSWPLGEAERLGREVEVSVDQLAARFGPLPKGRWGEPPERAVVLPLGRPGHPHPHGFFVAGVSPHRKLDERYLGLFRLTADQVMTAIANARAYEEAHRQAEALAAIERAKTACFSNVSHEFRTPLSLLLGPTADASSDPAVPRPASGPAVGLPASSSARILVAGDSADMRDDVRRLLAERWEVEVVSDCTAALQRARERRPDLIIFDVMMPELEGFGLLRELRGDARTSAIPVIMLSARAGEDASTEGRLQGANDYLVKPFSARELVGRVSAQLELSRVQRLVEEHLEIERKRLHTFLMEAPAAIAILRGPQLVYELANPRYLAMVGDHELVGKPAREALPALTAQGVWDIFDRIYRTGEPFAAQDFAVRLPCGGDQGAEVFFNWIAQPTRDRSGSIDGVLVFAIEVSEQVTARRQLEQARAIEHELRQTAESANRAKDEFLAMLGHELRNPLAPISTALHLMRLRGISAIDRERVVIERQVAHLIRLVDDLLDVSRITRGKVELQKKRIEISEVVAKAVEMASPMLEQRQHHLSLQVPPSDLLVDGDPTRLAQVLANLLTNAAKYTEPAGHIAVTARREGEQVVIKVSDDGMGISAEILPHIFELFMQERQALDRSSGGLGLGLAIVRSLLTMHGGSVEAASEGRGRGSTFTVRLPAAAPQHEPAATAHSIGSLTPGAGRTILVVDDNEDAAEVLAAGLELLGHRTRVAHDGPAALRVTADFKPDLALLDIGLPVMDGYELARRLRQDPSLAHIRLVAVTGYGQDSDRRRSQEAGFDAHLVKPIQLPELASLIKSLGDTSPTA